MKNINRVVVKFFKISYTNKYDVRFSYVKLLIKYWKYRLNVKD